MFLVNLIFIFISTTIMMKLKLSYLFMTWSPLVSDLNVSLSMGLKNELLNMFDSSKCSNQELVLYMGLLHRSRKTSNIEELFCCVPPTQKVDKMSSTKNVDVCRCCCFQRPHIFVESL